MADPTPTPSPAPVTWEELTEPQQRALAVIVRQGHAFLSNATEVRTGDVHGGAARSLERLGLVELGELGAWVLPLGRSVWEQRHG